MSQQEANLQQFIHVDFPKVHFEDTVFHANSLAHLGLSNCSRSTMKQPCQRRKHCLFGHCFNKYVLPIIKTCKIYSPSDKRVFKEKNYMHVILYFVWSKVLNNSAWQDLEVFKCRAIVSSLPYMLRLLSYQWWGTDSLVLDHHDWHWFRNEWILFK